MNTINKNKLKINDEFILFCIDKKTEEKIQLLIGKNLACIS
tara:strand:+ start:155 stop:277 length:123 start_codon:yes stop_codon:yes gene_type:complete